MISPQRYFVLVTDSCLIPYHMLDGFERGVSALAHICKNTGGVRRITVRSEASVPSVWKRTYLPANKRYCLIILRGNLTQDEGEYRRFTERWENEGGHWLHIVSREKMSEQEYWGINEFEVIPPLDEQRYEIAAAGPTLLNSTYFMKLWNAGRRTDKTDRRVNPLSINAEHHRYRTPSAEK